MHIFKHLVKTSGLAYFQDMKPVNLKVCSFFIKLTLFISCIYTEAFRAFVSKIHYDPNFESIFGSMFIGPISDNDENDVKKAIENYTKSLTALLEYV